MQRLPRDQNEQLLTSKTPFKSVMQGLVIFGASFGTYFASLNKYPDNAPIVRAMGITIILLANVLLVQVNSLNSEFAIKSFIKLIRDKVMWSVSLGTILGLLVILYASMCSFLKLAPLSLGQGLLAVAIAVVSVIWYEVIKAVKYIRKSR